MGLAPCQCFCGWSVILDKANNCFEVKKHDGKENEPRVQALLSEKLTAMITHGKIYLCPENLKCTCKISIK